MGEIFGLSNGQNLSYAQIGINFCPDDSFFGRVFDMFPCTSCGLCCQHIGHNVLYKDLDRGDGICKNLTNVMTCGIYDNRPVLCRIDEAYYAFFAQRIALQEYYKLNAACCYELQMAAGIPEDERIVLVDISEWRN